MRRRKIWIFFMTLLIASAGCTNKPFKKAQQIDRREIIRQALDHYLSATPENWRIVKNTWLKEKLDKGEINDLFILDIRSQERFNEEHIQGAVNIPFMKLAKKETLTRLPKNKTIVIVCNTGHSASMANVVLNLLSYKAVTMKYGMKGWGKKTILWLNKTKNIVSM